jgi:homocitrate synthase NifV
MKEKFYIVDTTLRDGAQTPGLSLRRDEIIETAKDLDDAGVYQIEAGIPASGQEEIETIVLIKKSVKNALVSTWNRMKEEDVELALKCNADIVHISVPSSDLQIKVKLKSDRKSVHSKMLKCVKIAKEAGAAVTVGFEDAVRASPIFLRELANSAKEAGVLRIRYSDTVGIAFPSFVKQNMKFLKETAIDMESHFHNDLGMAAANSYEALKNGARYVNTTLCGLGERAGNCDLTQFLVLSLITHTSAINKSKIAEAEEKIKRILSDRTKVV